MALYTSELRPEEPGLSRATEDVRCPLFGIGASGPSSIAKSIPKSNPIEANKVSVSLDQLWLAPCFWGLGTTKFRSFEDLSGVSQILSMLQAAGRLITGP